MDESKFLITGADGQLGRALQLKYHQAQKADRAELDISDLQSVDNFNWSGIEVILNAAGYTDVDGAEKKNGRSSAWQVNAVGVANLMQAAIKNDLTLVHISTDYVFDGTKDPHTEREPFSPLSVYGSSKAAGDIAASSVPKHYILRASWVVGDGKNFVRTMLEVGKKGINPTVVSDQIGRPTFTSELVRIIEHLLTSKAGNGTYNASNDGPATSWADLTREIFKQAGFKNAVADVSTAEYFKDKPPAAPRPSNSTLDLAKLQATGFTSRNWQEDLADYIKMEMQP